MKTSELKGKALDWAVGMALGYEMSLYGVDPSIRARVPGLGVIAPWRPTWYWNQIGPVMDREKIELNTSHNGKVWLATIDRPKAVYFSAEDANIMTAICRCFVLSVLGEEVTGIPKSLEGV